jgi:hypothetical protein
MATKMKMQTGGAKKTLAKAQFGKSVNKPKTYNQQLMQKFPKMSANDTLPENSYARAQFYAPSAYDAAKAKVDRTNEDNDSYGESRNRSKKELKTMKKDLDGYKKTGGSIKKMKTGGMVNSNAKLTASKKATGKVGGVTKAVSKATVKTTAPKGRVGGTSTAPKTATPKMKMGGSMKRK